MKSPFLEYSPSIGPSKILFYNADEFVNMKADLLLATLRGENIFQLHFEDGVVQQRKLFEDGEYGRIRAISVGPDGFIYFSTSQVDPPEGKPRKGDDMLLRIRPGKNKKDQKFEESFELNEMVDSSSENQNLYQQLCLSCHGAQLQGTERGPSLVDEEWIYGETKADITKIIRDGAINNGMPAWDNIISNDQINKLSDYILNIK